MLWGTLHHTNNTFYNIIHVCKVSVAVAVVE